MPSRMLTQIPLIVRMASAGTMMRTVQPTGTLKISSTNGTITILCAKTIRLRYTPPPSMHRKRHANLRDDVVCGKEGLAAFDDHRRNEIPDHQPDRQKRQIAVDLHVEHAGVNQSHGSDHDDHADGQPERSQ